LTQTANHRVYFFTPAPDTVCTLATSLRPILCFFLDSIIIVVVIAFVVVLLVTAPTTFHPCSSSSSSLCLVFLSLHLLLQRIRRRRS
jgi:hypothetical protein